MGTCGRHYYTLGLCRVLAGKRSSALAPLKQAHLQQKSVYLLLTPIARHIDLVVALILIFSFPYFLILQLSFLSCHFIPRGYSQKRAE